MDEWWERIADSRKFAENGDAIRAYQATLQPGDVTLVGLIAEGGQGMRTANNARFLGYLAGTPKADSIALKREQWTRAWLANPRIRPVFCQLLEENGGDAAYPTADVAAWEAAVEPLKSRFDAIRVLGFYKTDLYRVVQTEWLAGPEDFQFAWQRRKAELLPRWQQESLFNGFWSQPALGGNVGDRAALRRALDISDADFCGLCQDLQAWIEAHKKGRARCARRWDCVQRDLPGAGGCAARGDDLQWVERAGAVGAVPQGRPGRQSVGGQRAALY